MYESLDWSDVAAWVGWSVAVDVDVCVTDGNTDDVTDDPSASRTASRLSGSPTRGVEVALRCIGASARTGSDGVVDACVSGSVAGVVADVEVLNDFAGECEMGAVFVLGFSSESPRGRASSTCASSRCTRLGRTSVGCTASTAGMGDGVDAGDVVTGASRADPGGSVVAGEVSVEGCWESFTWSDGASAIGAVVAAGAEPRMRVERGRR